MTCQSETAETTVTMPRPSANDSVPSPTRGPITPRATSSRSGGGDHPTAQVAVVIPQQRRETMATFCPRCGRRLLNTWCSWCAEFAPESVVGRFQIREVLSTGRLGSLLRGYDPALARTVVLRTLGAAELAPDALAHYLAVLRQASGLPHPNCVDVYTVQLGADGPLVVMEDIRGGGISQSPDGQNRQPSAHLQNLVDVLEGVAFLHGHGLAHGRITTKTVLLTSSGTAKLTDPGAGQDPQASASWQMAAPEVLLGDGPSPAADVFSAGALLWIGSAGCPPFAAGNRTAAVVARRRSPRGVAAPKVGELARQAMQFDPDNRPTARELGAILRSLLPVRDRAGRAS